MIIILLSQVVARDTPTLHIFLFSVDTDMHVAMELTYFGISATFMEVLFITYFEFSTIKQVVLC
jgi:hypothetical protein